MRWPRGTGKEVRVSVLGHIQRGGSPTPFDRILAHAVRGGSGGTDCSGRLRKNGLPAQRMHRVVWTSADAVGQLKTVDPQGELVRAARAIGISFGD